MDATTRQAGPFTGESHGATPESDYYSVVDGVFLNVPRSFAGILPPSPCRLNFPFEASAFLGLESLVRPGAVVFDVGCSYGVFSALLARLVGARGRVYAFEANPEVLPLARELAEHNGLAGRVRFLNLCVGEASGREAELHVLPHFQSVASSRNEGIKKTCPEARTIKVPLAALDDLCASTIPEAPEMIKLDIEGGECCALQGARNLLREHAPDLVIETHGLEINDIGGSLEELCGELQGLGYGLFDLNKGEMTDAGDYVLRYGTGNAQLLASRKLRHSGVGEAMRAKHQWWREYCEQSSCRWRELDRARECVNGGRAAEAEPLLRGFLVWSPDHSEAHYLLGVALQALGRITDDTLREYQLAACYGFDEFWVRFQMGSLHILRGDRQQAIQELRRALALKPDDPGAKSLLARV